MKPHFIDLSQQGGETGRWDSQSHWHSLVPEITHDCTLLDIGAGLGRSKERMSCNGIVVVTQDPAPDLSVDVRDDVAAISSNSYDVVTAFDVMEHVVNYSAFAQELLRIAREHVFASTPNFDYRRGIHPYHYQEFRPAEFVHLFGVHRFRRGWMAFENKARAVHEEPLEAFLGNKFCHSVCVLVTSE